MYILNEDSDYKFDRIVFVKKDKEFFYIDMREKYKEESKLNFTRIFTELNQEEIMNIIIIKNKVLREEVRKEITI